MTRNPLPQETLDRIAQEKRDFAPIAEQMVEEFRRLCELPDEEFQALMDDYEQREAAEFNRTVETPLDTPLDQWVPGVDAMLDDMNLL